jgi:hypothetical protein
MVARLVHQAEFDLAQDTEEAFHPDFAGLDKNRTPRPTALPSTDVSSCSASRRPCRSLPGSA